MAKRSLTSKLLLALAGALCGLALWAVFGLALHELGALPRFDPFGTTESPAEPTIAVRIAEWSFPLCALLGAALLSRIVDWLTEPSDFARRS